jgi:hypothetical protein
MGDPSGNASYTIPSTRERELAFVAHHGTHHLYTVRLMCEHLKVDIKDMSIGVANSTLKEKGKQI